MTSIQASCWSEPGLVIVNEVPRSPKKWRTKGCASGPEQGQRDQSVWQLLARFLGPDWQWCRVPPGNCLWFGAAIIVEPVEDVYVRPGSVVHLARNRWQDCSIAGMVRSSRNLPRLAGVAKRHPACPCWRMPASDIEVCPAFAPGPMPETLPHVGCDISKKARARASH